MVTVVLSKKGNRQATGLGGRGAWKLTVHDIGPRIVRCQQLQVQRMGGGVRGRDGDQDMISIGLEGQAEEMGRRVHLQMILEGHY